MSALLAYIARGCIPITRKVRWLVEVILHVGAHRTSTTSFQQTLRQNRNKLIKNGIEFWGPRETRGGRFDGLARPTDTEDWDTERRIGRSRGAIRMELERFAKKGRKTLLVSEENMMGTIRANLRTGSLYADIETRLARFRHVFGDTCRRVGLAVRPYEEFWASSMAYAIPQGHRAFGEDDLDRLVTHPRGWRDVIRDAARAFDGAEIVVWEFSRLAGRSPAQLRLLMNGRGAPVPWFAPSRIHANRAPAPAALREVLKNRGEDADAPGLGETDACFMPFGAHHLAAMHDKYREDLEWLRGVSGTGVAFVEPGADDRGQRGIAGKRGVG